MHNLSEDDVPFEKGLCFFSASSHKVFKGKSLEAKKESNLRMTTPNVHPKTHP